MGGKRAYLIFFAAFITVTLSAQDHAGFRYADSITWKLYTEARWDELIAEGRKALRAGTDYKFLRQRLGHAFYMKGDYIRSIRHFSEALSYDSYDLFTLEYLGYAYAMTGRSSHAGVFESRINSLTPGKPGIEPFRLVDHLDVEFDFKKSLSSLRSAVYYRLGLGTKAGSRLGVYQSFSSYHQSVTDTATFKITQPGYYVSLAWNASSHLVFTGSYSYMHALSDGDFYPAHLLLLAVSPDFRFINFSLQQSVLIIEGSKIFQTGISSTIYFPGRSGFYLKGSVAALYNEVFSNIVYAPAAGIRLWKGALLEGFFTGGGIEWYNDFNGLYVYNSYDPVSRKAGATFYQSANNKILFWLNIAGEKKAFAENPAAGYSQLSILGGLRWKM